MQVYGPLAVVSTVAPSTSWDGLLVKGGKKTSKQLLGPLQDYQTQICSM